MSKNERKRTIVYSNVNKKADVKSASSKDDLIDLDDEVFIGLASFPKPRPKDIDKRKKIKKQNNIKEVSKENSTKKSSQKENIQRRNPQKVNTKNENFKSKKIIVNETKNNHQITLQEKIRKQKRRAIKRMSICLLLLILIIGGIIYFLLSPVFNVKAIQVLNNNHISSEELINMSGIALNENMFKFSKKEAKNNILSNPYIEEVNISRNIFSDEIKIDVKERTATLMLEYGNSYVYINNQGYILEISAVKLDSPIIKGYVTPLEDVKPGNRLNKDDLGRLKTVLKILDAANSNDIENLITQINIKNKRNYTITLESEDKTVYLGTCSDLSTQMLHIKEMIEKEKGVEGEFFLDMDLNTTRPVFREKV